MSHEHKHIPPDSYPDDFSDLEQDGWYVHVTPAEDHSSGQPGVLLLPPGVGDSIEKPNDVDFLLRYPHILMSGVDDGREGVTVAGAVQTVLEQSGQRHEAFKGERRAHLLARRALWILGASRLRFAWHSDGAGMLGSDNYAAYHTHQRASNGGGYVDRREAARSTWTYQKIAKPYGLTEVSDVNVELPPIVWDARSDEEPVQRRIVTGYFESPSIDD